MYKIKNCIKLKVCVICITLTSYEYKKYKMQIHKNYTITARNNMKSVDMKTVKVIIRLHTVKCFVIIL